MTTYCHESRCEMKPWIKRTIVGAVLGTSIVIIGGSILFIRSFSDICGNEIAVELISPDKNYKAVIFQRDCGATTGFSTQVSVLGANEELENKSGNIFIADGHPESNRFEATWINSQVLLLSNTRNARTFKREKSIEKIEIRYE